jgi:hypothetical protein
VNDYLTWYGRVEITLLMLLCWLTLDIVARDPPLLPHYYVSASADYITSAE